MKIDLNRLNANAKVDHSLTHSVDWTSNSCFGTIVFIPLILVSSLSCFAQCLFLVFHPLEFLLVPSQLALSFFPAKYPECCKNLPLKQPLFNNHCTLPSKIVEALGLFCDLTHQSPLPSFEQLRY